ncbi:MAG: thioredoxin domain-containing protein [Verrucomicrobiae bacterium]
MSTETAMEKHTNRLANEKSPYLLQHAHNPVDWHPWGEEAFAKARRENKTVFLSVGYSTCHWCHVMERESFENPEIAAFLNRHFVSIKVDREERPDVDRVYMTFVQATTGRGGWPMSVWLTPDLKPFVGGTYFPPDDAFGRTGFLSMLQQIAGAWEKAEDQVRAQADRIIGQLRNVANARSDPNTALTAEVLSDGLKEMERRFDNTAGGFGPAPKFPRPSELLFLFHEAYRVGPDSKAGKRAIEMAAFSLEKMAAGGIHDHLGGGFHRYSTDAQWHVPHFEKMLYDQAQLAEAYLIAHQITGRAVFADTARDTLDYVLRNMTSAEGGFFSAEDADSAMVSGSQEKAEGVFYVWTADEIEAALGRDRAAEFDYVHGVEPGGNTSGESDPHGELHGKNVLLQRHDIPEAAGKFGVSAEEMKIRLAASREKLLAIRAGRPRPHLDDKVITAWNGLMITALAKGYQVLGDEKYLDAANRSADFIRKNLLNEKSRTLLRSWRDGTGTTGGFAEDYAFLIRGLIDLYESGFDTARLEWAVAIQKMQDELFFDDKDGGYFSSHGDDPSVLLRMKEDYDGAEPSPNTLSALNLLRLAHLLGNQAWADKAERTLKTLAQQMRQSPLATPMGLVALDSWLSPAEQIVIVGKNNAPGTLGMAASIWRKFLPGAVWALIGDEVSHGFFARQADFYGSLQPVDDKSTAYVCKDFVCNLPVTDPAAFERQLAVAHKYPAAAKSSSQ